MKHATTTTLISNLKLQHIRSNSYVFYTTKAINNVITNHQTLI
ncbi:hypothetical protein NIES2104_46210 [Leptolyngbya sp. NIES-2104]|nr:hypothetical protein NIES2104_46210 [Leptolyngbya sp. NIES-2104]